jgi:hypothetical integral membrane protein (TIGR02206 family)
VATPGRALAVVILAGFVGEQLTYALRGEWTVQVNLPLQLSDAVTLASVAALATRSAPLVELMYFWALSASLQAVITPDLGQPFPDLLYFTYFATRSGAIAAACLLMFGARRTPRRDAVWRVYATTVAFAACAAAATLVTGGNYMCLRHKPAPAGSATFRAGWPSPVVRPRGEECAAGQLVCGGAEPSRLLAGCPPNSGVVATDKPPRFREGTRRS